MFSPLSANRSLFLCLPTVPLFLSTYCSSVPTVLLCLLFLCALCSSVPTVPLCLYNFVDRPLELLRHQSARLQKCCMKLLQSLFSLVFRRPHYYAGVGPGVVLCSFLRSSPRISFEQKRDRSQSRNIDAVTLQDATKAIL